MDLLDRLLGHDAWTTRQLLKRSRGLSDEALDRKFPIGHGSLRATFAHMIWNMEAWTDLMRGRKVRARSGPEAAGIPHLIGRLDAIAEDFASMARQVRDAGRWDEVFTDTLANPPVPFTLGGGIAHLITHSMHHRAQVLNIMRHLGIEDLIEGDALGWEAAQTLKEVPHVR